VNVLQILISVVSFGLDFLIVVAAAVRAAVGAVQGVPPTAVVQIVEGVTVTVEDVIAEATKSLAKYLDFIK